MTKIEEWIKRKIKKENKNTIKNKKLFNKPENRRNFSKHPKEKLRIIPLGGLEEIGKNMMVVEYSHDIFIIDIGMQFPEEDMLGIDYVIPDITYLTKKLNSIRGIVITHGHLDHIGALPHLIKKLGNPEIFGTKLTLGLAKKRLEEFNLSKTTKLNTITTKDKIRLGKSFVIEFFHINHSIPDGVGLFIKTPVGNIVYTGDFKFDFSPADDKPADLARIAEIGRHGVLAAFIDSTNAAKKGHAISEKIIGENLDKIIREAKGRIIIAAFSSLIGRIQQIINSSVKINRKVFFSGRSMIENVEIAKQLNYISAPKGILRKISPNTNALPAKEVLILTTGSQGESMSALTRISLGDHPHIKIREGDTVVLSSSPIVGNEKAITAVINNLYSQGANVITNNSMDVHTTGHAQQEDLKLMYNLLKPKFLVPIHGELYMRMEQKKLALSVGKKSSDIILLSNGDILELDRYSARKSKQKVPANNIMIDGLGVGDIGTKVIRDRQIMANDGVIIILFKTYEKTGRMVCDPDIISRGFIYMKESAEIAKEIRKIAKKAYLDEISSNTKINDRDLKEIIKKNLMRFIRKRIDREPMILPIIIKV